MFCLSRLLWVAVAVAAVVVVVVCVHTHSARAQRDIYGVSFSHTLPCNPMLACITSSLTHAHARAYSHAHANTHRRRSRFLRTWRWSNSKRARRRRLAASRPPLPRAPPVAARYASQLVVAQQTSTYQTRPRRAISLTKRKTTSTHVPLS